MSYEINERLLPEARRFSDNQLVSEIKEALKSKRNYVAKRVVPRLMVLSGGATCLALTVDALAGIGFTQELTGWGVASLQVIALGALGMKKGILATEPEEDLGTRATLNQVYIERLEAVNEVQRTEVIFPDLQAVPNDTLAYIG